MNEKKLQIDVFEVDEALHVGFLYADGLSPSEIMEALDYVIEAASDMHDELKLKVN